VSADDSFIGGGAPSSPHDERRDGKEYKTKDSTDSDTGYGAGR
jgi:hypothetical protein